MNRMPFPSNENTVASSHGYTSRSKRSPWKVIKPGEPQPLLVQFSFADGRSKSFAIPDIRETAKRDAGFIQIWIFGMEKYLITIEGRHLSELHDLLQIGRIKEMQELGPRTFDRPESEPSIDKITVEPLTGSPQ